MTKPLRVLIVDDEENFASFLVDHLHYGGYQITSERVDSAESMAAALNRQRWDLILCDYVMPGFSGLDALRVLKQKEADIPFILISGKVGEDVAVEAMKTGAHDYVMKSDLSRLLPAVERELREARMRLDRRWTGEQLLRVNRALRLLNSCNQALMFSGDEGSLLQEVCQLCVQVGGYRFAWVGFAEPDAAQTVRPVASAGHEAGYLATVQVTWADSERGRGPVGTAIRTRQAVVIDDVRTDQRYCPWREAATSRGYGSVVALPLVREDHPMGALAVYAAQPNAFDEEELALLTEATKNLAYGIATRRERAARESAEQARRASEEYARIIINSSLDMIIAVDRERKIIEFNPAAEQGFGYQCQEVLGQPVDLLYAGPDQSLKVHHLTVALGKCVEEIWNRRKNGELFPCLLMASPLRDANGNIVGTMGISRDISDQKKAKEQLNEQAELLNLALDAIVVNDLEDRITFWNKGAERLYGWPADEAVGREISTLIYRDPALLVAAKKDLLAKGEWSGELVQRTRDDREITVSSRWNLLRDQQGKPRSVLGINSDITEKKKYESQFLHAQRMEGIGRLAGGIAHDLNNILAPILMSIQILRAKPLDEEGQNLLATVEACTQRGADIVKQVLTFARRLDGKRALLQPRHLIKEVVKMISQTFPKNITVTSRMAKDLWTITGDATQLHQVLLNLCVNARDAMPSGGTLLLAASNVELDEQYVATIPNAKVGPSVVIQVTDTGLGIPREVIDKIFDPFFTTKEIGKGTGLGLSAVLGIVHSHGGFVSVQSRVGKGTTFKVHLPATPGGEFANDGTERPSLPCGHGEVILIVDDEAPIRDVTGATLKKFGYQVLTACDGTDALAMVAQHRNEIKAVVTDMMMPEMDGVALVRALQKIDPEMKIIISSGIATGMGKSQVVETMKLIGIKTFLVKPYSAESLLTALHETLHPNATG
ncbi:MAG: response regulator [Limisphaerales bacterium]